MPRKPRERVLTLEAEALLNRLTEEDKMLCGRDKLYAFVRKNYPEVLCSRRDVMHWLRSKTWWQRTVQYPKRKDTSSIVVKSPRYFSCDVKGPLPRAVGGWEYVFAINQLSSRKAFLSPMKGAGAVETSQALQQMIDENDLDIATIRHDNGQHFQGAFSDFCKEQGIVQIFNPPHSPWMCRTERLFWDFSKWLTKLEQLTGKKGLWQKELHKFQDLTNSTVNRSIKSAPNDAGDIPGSVLEAREKSYGNMKRFRNQRTALQVGDLVRLKVRKREGFKANKLTFSEAVYTIGKVIRGTSKLITYKLELNGQQVNHTYNITDLLKVPNALPGDLEIVADYGSADEPRSIHNQREVDELLRDVAASDGPVPVIRETRRPGPVENDNNFEIETILGQRKFGKQVKYLVKWVGYPREDSTWLPAREINAPELMAEWRKTQRAKKK